LQEGREISDGPLRNDKARESLETWNDWELTMRSKLLLAFPVLLPAVMCLVFLVYRHFFIPRFAHLLGMATYWILTLVISFGCIGRTGLLRIVKGTEPHGALWVLLIIPVALALGFGPFLKRILVVTPLVVILSLIQSFVNASLEEIFWRGVYIDSFKDVWRGCLYPAAGFAVWHFAPLSVIPYSHGQVSFVVSAFFLGLCWGFVAFRTKSVRWTILSHCLVDFSGFGALLYLAR